MLEMKAVLQISPHLLSVYEVVKERDCWLTAKQIAVTGSVAERTTRHHCRQLTEAGVFRCMRLFGGYRYRLAKQPSGERVAMLEAARSALTPNPGENLSSTSDAA